MISNYQVPPNLQDVQATIGIFSVPNSFHQSLASQTNKYNTTQLPIFTTTKPMARNLAPVSIVDYSFSIASPILVN